MRIPQVFKTKNILLLITFNPLHPSHTIKIKLSIYSQKRQKQDILSTTIYSPLASRGCNLDFSFSAGQVDLIIRQ